MMSRNLPASHQRGQKLYRSGDFEAAVDAFGEALKQKDADVTGVLDNRCAAFCKLEKYDQALRDARHMIKNSKEDDRGYLRCAQVLVLQKKPEKALEIYAYGLKMLPAGHPRRETLEYMQKKLQDGLMLNRRDPFSVLPLEMAVMVLSHFSFREIVGILRVSKGWLRFLNSLPNLWLKMDFTGARKNVPWTSVRSYVRQSKGNLTHAVIKRLPHNSTSKSLEFVSRCPRIEHLELWVNHPYKESYTLFREFQRLKSLVLGPDIAVPRGYFFRILNEARQLERIKIMNLDSKLPGGHIRSGWPESLPNLRSIDLSSKSDASSIPLALPFLDEIDQMDIQNAGSFYRPEIYPNLEEVRLNWLPQKLTYYGFCDTESLDDYLDADGNVRHLPPIRHFELRGMVPGKCLLTLLADNIESLTIQGGPSLWIDGFTFHRIAQGKEFSALHTLVINDAAWLLADTLNQFLEAFKPNIHTLSLESCFRFSTAAFKFDLPSNEQALRNLADLNMANINGITDNSAMKLFETFPHLKSLNLSSTAITGRTIRRFADARASDSDNEPKLDRLIVKNCEEISSDAVQYGRDKGLEVII